MNTNAAEYRQALRDAVTRFLALRYPFERRQTALRSPLGRDEALWRGLADEVCVLGAAYAEYTDSDAPLDDAFVILEELGAALAAEPYLGTVMGGGQWLSRSDAPLAKRVLGELVAGDAIVVLAGGMPDGASQPAELDAVRTGETVRVDGSVALITAAPWATHFVALAVCDGQAIAVLVPARSPGLMLREFVTIDGGRAADVTFSGVEVPVDRVLADGTSATVIAAFVEDCVTVGLCSEAIGILRKLCRDTTDYAQQRRQFGHAISEYQVIRHRLVDMHIALEQSVAVTSAAADRLSSDPSERARAVSAAKWYVSRACRSVGESAVQIHGAIGTTEELAIGHYFKRALVIAQRHGTADDHRRRFERVSRH